MDIIFHGVRGSTPVPLSNFQKYGGNTTCIEIRHPSFQIILDAGTGFQNVEILGDRPTFLLFSHFHYDHLQGLPFCPGLFDPTRSILISSALVTKQELRETLGQAFKPSYFPIPLFDAFSHLKVVEFKEIKKSLSDVCEISSLELNHPGGAAACILKVDNIKICVFLDHEHGQEENKGDEELYKIAQNSDLVIWDGMFIDSELPAKKGWGHSSIQQGLDFANVVSCKKMAICHHAPTRTDKQLEKLAQKHENNIVKLIKEGTKFKFNFD
ncbi:MAG: hypothetical protein CML47_06770 [Rhodobacteraceae bacterium]|nr:MAG: hypothetical protein CML47_06770 [Paracoccaceae bacterium]